MITLIASAGALPPTAATAPSPTTPAEPRGGHAQATAQAEAARTEALAAIRPVSPPGPPRFDWPLAPPPSVSRPFQPPTQPYGPGHRGVDLAGRPAQPVLAAGDGVVIYAGPLAGRGVISIQHADGLRTSYEPVLASVRAGQWVVRGTALGTLVAGHHGCLAAACLHWGLRKEGHYLDPLMLVRRRQVRLLPWPTGTSVALAK